MIKFAPSKILKVEIMAVTRLKRKGRRNRMVATAKVDKIQRLNAKPVIKNVDVEAVKAEFAKK